MSRLVKSKDSTGGLLPINAIPRHPSPAAARAHIGPSTITDRAGLGSRGYTAATASPRLAYGEVYRFPSRLSRRRACQYLLPGMADVHGRTTRTTASPASEVPYQPL